MSILTYILLFTFLGSIVSLIGGVLLLSKEQFARKISHYLSPFAAGTLLGTAFLDLLPEALTLSKNSNINIFLWGLIGLLIFFLLERFIHWFHHHHEDSKNESLVSLVVLGDSIHNFIDGAIIAATFLVSIPLGIATTFAVATHEVPQEIGDFGILLTRGLKRKKILLLNIMSALAAVVGAILMYAFGENFSELLPIFLSLAAGFFIYIASSDLIPEIHNEDNRRVASLKTFLLLLGVITVYVLISFFEH